MGIIDTVSVARLEEGRQTRAVREIADEWTPFAGGVMSRAAPGSWMNVVVGAGMDAPVSADEVASLVDHYACRGIEPRVEMCPFADPSFMAELEAAGFTLRILENVLVRPLDAGEAFTPLHAAPPGLVIEQIDPSDAVAIREYVLTAMAGFIPPGVEAPDAVIASAERAARHPRTVAIVARLPGEAGRTVVGAGGMEIAGEIASLFGLSVAEPFRRRGIQQAMLAYRLRLAAQRGARVATIGSKPGAHTERNVRRMGFELAYTKPVLAKRGPGLIPAMG